MNNDLNEIRIFTEVAKFQSFTKAAQFLKIEKSTVSTKVKQLEARLGIRLLQRTTRKVHLTPAGESYLSYCQEALNALTRADNYIAELSDTPSGYLKVATPHNFLQAVSQTLINPFLDAYPNVSLEVVQLDNNVDLITEGFDLAVRYEYRDAPDSSLVYRKLFNTEWITVASPKYIKLYGEPKSLAEINQFPSVGALDAHKAKGENDKQNLFWGETKVPLKHRFVSNDTRAMISAIKGGLGFGVLPKGMIQSSLDSGELIKFGEHFNMPNSTLYVVYPSRVGQPPKAKAFVEALLAWAHARQSKK